MIASERADRALYIAKRMGHNRVDFWPRNAQLPKHSTRFVMSVEAAVSSSVLQIA